MLLDMVKKFNWFDIFVIIILFRIGYIAIKTGLPIEFFKLLGTVAAVYLSLHYYTMFSDFIQSRFTNKELSLEFLDFLSFIILAIVSYSIFMSLRIVFHHLVKMEAVPSLNRWGGFVLGIVRGFLLAGLIAYLLAISSISYLKNSVKDSYSGGCFFRVASGTYSWLWNTVTSKFMNSEKFNKNILEVQEGFAKK